jgi:hypothetical protein
MQHSSAPEQVGARSTPTPTPVSPHAAARIPGEPIAECVQTTGQLAVGRRVADDAWRPIFDIAGWQIDLSILLCPSHGAMPAAFTRSADG